MYACRYEREPCTGKIYIRLRVYTSCVVTLTCMVIYTLARANISNAIHGVDSYLTDKCCIHAGQSASLLAFEESDAWVPRIEEFNRCTGAQVRLEYLPEGEDGMADALRADLGDDAEVEAMMGNGGQGIFDAYIVQGPW